MKTREVLEETNVEKLKDRKETLEEYEKMYTKEDIESHQKEYGTMMYELWLIIDRIYDLFHTNNKKSWE